MYCYSEFSTKVQTTVPDMRFFMCDSSQLCCDNDFHVALRSVCADAKRRRQRQERERWQTHSVWMERERKRKERKRGREGRHTWIFLVYLLWYDDGVGLSVSVSMSECECEWERQSHRVCVCKFRPLVYLLHVVPSQQAGALRGQFPGKVDEPQFDRWNQHFWCWFLEEN